MEELMRLVRDHRVDVATVLERVEALAWTREWLWERLKAVDDSVIEVLARLSQASASKGTPAEAASAWMRSLRSRKIAPPGSGAEVESTLEFRLVVAFRMHQWLWVRQTCLDRALEGTLHDPLGGDPEGAAMAREAYERFLDTGYFEYTERGRLCGYDHDPDEEMVAREYFGSEEMRRMHSEWDWLGDWACEESVQRLRERHGRKRN